MEQKKNEEVEIETLNEDSLGSVAGGAMIVADSDGCPSDGCPSDGCPSDGCPR